ncbi:unnamed protein product [Candidula unifasciata]|uniref:TIR domain-containing protein n=1 Tax=Candidula unifasciata TaxID=100452 RepID=A0A8S3Z5H3_9EUPU|nr:unnamed protein product [Candidula unifasciata]
MAAGVSVMEMILWPLLLTLLNIYVTLPHAKAVAFPTSPYLTVADPYSNVTCPAECRCSKLNETSVRWMRLISCSVSHISPHLTSLLNQMPGPVTGHVHFTCTNNPDTDVPPESKLWDGAFKNLYQLRLLVFDRCKFRILSKHAFRGMSSLTELLIRDAIIDNIDPDLLVYLPQLGRLEISNSAITHLFPLCTAASLTFLNISGNRLASLGDSVLNCPNRPLYKLESLVANDNLLTNIPPWLDQSLPNLHHLNLANNYISQFHQSPFQNLHQLEVLDISNNSLTNLGESLFLGSSNILRLDMSKNKVSTFSRGLVANLSALQQLDISGMDLDDKVWLEISELRQLVHLNMSHNQLTGISTYVMSQLTRLKYCYLDNNRISSIPASAFSSQIHMDTLDLSFNKIADMSPLVFANQVSLKHLYLHHNQLSALGYDSIAQLDQLLTIDVSHNSLSFLPSATLEAFASVTYIDMSFNNLSNIDSNLFIKTLHVLYLNISHNSLTEAPVVSQLLQMRLLDMSYNRIAHLNSSLLSELGSLTTLVLSHNQISSLPVRLLKGCENIRSIDLSYNFIKSLDDSLFSSTVVIEHIDMSYNQITDIRTVFNGLKHLETLDLSYNRIDKIMRGQFPHFVKHLHLQGNQIMFITAHTFKSLNKLQMVDLSENKLTSLNRMDVEIAFNMDIAPIFYLQSNPFVCDCRLGWLKDWTLGRLDNRTLPVFHLDSGLGCSSPFYEELKSLEQLSRSDFLCSYTSYCEESCMCCDYACYCKYACPAACLCYIGDGSLHSHHVKCNSADLTTVPAELPEGATNLRLDGNHISVLHRHQFLALKHVQVLYLNNSQITAIENSTFKGLKSVQVLYLQDNLLTAVYSVTFQGLDSLQELFLQNNQIYSLDIQSFLLPSILHLVNLQDNSLSAISFEDLEHLANRTLDNGATSKVYLSGNPWNCEADFACKFLSLAQQSPEFIADLPYIECAHIEINGKPLHAHPENTLLLDVQLELCGSNQTSLANGSWLNLKGSSSKSETYALIAACLVVLCGMCLLTVAYVNRHLIQVLLYARFGVRVFKATKPSEDSDRPYDAFISYSNKDEDFVVHQLAPRLENGKQKFRLCVHYRDFPAGACIADTIVRSLEASKRTILVVSNHFLDSEWCRFEFQAAHQQVLSKRCNRVILIRLHNLDPGKVDDDLRMYMKTRTYLKYDDPWFWEKLTFVMPDIRHRKVYMPSQLPSSRELEYMDHEMCLSEPQQTQLYPRFHINGSCSQCEVIHNGMYEIPVFDSPSTHYHLANSVGCSIHTNSAYHNSDASDCTAGYNTGSGHGSCCHYEEVGPGSGSLESTPRKEIGTPPPVPLIPKEGFIPRQKLVPFQV